MYELCHCRILLLLETALEPLRHPDFCFFFRTHFLGTTTMRQKNKLKNKVSCFKLLAWEVLDCLLLVLGLVTEASFHYIFNFLAL